MLGIFEETNIDQGAIIQRLSSFKDVLSQGDEIR